jgi:F-type H+-transporting ATPase subunit a
MLDAAHILAVNIPIGDHITRSVFGVKLNLDTIWTTVVAAAIVLGLGFYMRAKATAEAPGKVQLLWETVVGGVTDQVESNIGPGYGQVVPLAVTIFMLVLAADWLEILPGLFHNTDYSPSPSADVNLTYALASVVFLVTNVAGIRKKGIFGYIKHFFRPPVLMFPLHILEEIVRPISLALRLFGNLFSGGIMIALLISFPIFFFPASIALTVVWKIFDMFIGLLQAFIFALLTILYYQSFVAEGGH